MTPHLCQSIIEECDARSTIRVRPFPIHADARLDLVNSGDKAPSLFAATTAPHYAN